MCFADVVSKMWPGLQGDCIDLHTVFQGTEYTDLSDFDDDKVSFFSALGAHIRNIHGQMISTAFLNELCTYSGLDAVGHCKNAYFIVNNPNSEKGYMVCNHLDKTRHRDLHTYYRCSLMRDAMWQYNVIIEINENENGFFVFRISDDGDGMSEEMVQKIRDPFVTTRTTRKVGMGIPFMDMVTKQCGGHLLIQSRKGKGTVVEAAFAKDNIDRPPLGDIVSSIKVLLVGTPYLELKFIYKIGTSGFDIDTRVIRSLLGDEADFTRPEVYTWFEEYLKQEISQLRCEQEV